MIFDGLSEKACPGPYNQWNWITCHIIYIFKSSFNNLTGSLFLFSLSITIPGNKNSYYILYMIFEGLSEKTCPSPYNQ